MARVDDTAYIVYDTETVPDGALLARVKYAGEDLSPEDAIARFDEENPSPKPGQSAFVPVTYQVPVGICVARVDARFRLLDLAALDAPEYRPAAMVRAFWKGVDVYKSASLVDFNGRGFDLPLLALSAFRFGISCPRYFGDPDRWGFRYRFTAKHIDLMEWMTEYGAFRLTGGLNLLAKILGKPGKMGTSGGDVAALYAEGKVQEINDYCLHDVLDTYFVFLRTRLLTGALTLEEEQGLVADAKDWLAARAETTPALVQYLENFGDWTGEPFV